MAETNITIPPEALEAAAIELMHHTLSVDRGAWYELPVKVKVVFEDDARAACIAMLKAWPGMDTRPNIYGRQDAILILPLTENSNDKG